MNVHEALEEVERRIPGAAITKRAGVMTVWRMAGRRYGIGSGRSHNYDDNDIERIVAWERLNEVAGEAFETPLKGRLLRRFTIDSLPSSHRPGWLVMTDTLAGFFGESEELPSLEEGPVIAVRVHDDCRCLA